MYLPPYSLSLTSLAPFARGCISLPGFKSSFFSNNLSLINAAMCICPYGHPIHIGYCPKKSDFPSSGSHQLAIARQAGLWP